MSDRHPGFCDYDTCGECAYADMKAVEADRDAKAALLDEAVKALEEIERQDTFWRDGGSGNHYGPSAELATAILTRLRDVPVRDTKGGA